MRQASFLFLALVVSQTCSAPQFITFKDGKIGVNFGGYHAGVGFGNGGGLFAEAGTPHGQQAMAGLGGYNAHTGSQGGLFAGATAGGNIQASAGLGGGVNGQSSSGGGFASAQAGGLQASTGLGGLSSPSGSSGFTFSGSNSFGIPRAVVKETNISIKPVDQKPLVTEEKKIHKELHFDAANEVEPLPLNANAAAAASAGIDTKINIKAESQPAAVVKEVYVEPETKIVEKHVVKTHSKPHRSHIHNTAYIGGYVGSGADIFPLTNAQKRIDVGVQGDSDVGPVVTHTRSKDVSVGTGPTFFQDIFNIPISTLQAVGNFLSNSAANTKLSVQKPNSASADGSLSVDASQGSLGEQGSVGSPDTLQPNKHPSNTLSPKHAFTPLSSSSGASISVETPSVSKIIDDIIAIPINTLGAVNKFLENNVQGRKRIQVSQEESGEPTRVRLGPHARRRANKRIVIVKEETTTATETKKPEEKTE